MASADFNPVVDADYDRVPELLWRRSLIDRPARPLVVNLDLNHWIGLAKAATGHRDGVRHRDAWAVCLAAREAGDAIFPISDAHYVEMSKIRNPRQRAEVADVMETLSGFTTYLSRPTVMRLEVDLAVAHLTGLDTGLLPGLPLLGHGVAWAFGRVGRRIGDDTGHITDTFRVSHPRVWAEMSALLEREMLRGPADSQLAALRAAGWRPDAGTAVAEERAQEEREQTHRFDSNAAWRRGRIRDVVLAREVIIELWDMLVEALKARNMSFADLGVDTDRSKARQLVRSMPSSEVSVELKVAAHRNPQLRWTANDIYDTDAMSLAVPYSDIVATERRACHLLRAAHLDERMGTVIVARPDDLAEALRPYVGGW